MKNGLHKYNQYLETYEQDIQTDEKKYTCCTQPAQPELITMKKIMLILFLAAAVAGLVTVAITAADRDTVETWEGSLRLFGNEPFTRVALVTDSGDRWFLDMDEQELQLLWEERREKIRITGVPVLKEIAGRTENYIKVIKYSWITENE